MIFTPLYHRVEIKCIIGENWIDKKCFAGSSFAQNRDHSIQTIIIVQQWH